MVPWRSLGDGSPDPRLKGGKPFAIKNEGHGITGYGKVEPYWKFLNEGTGDVVCLLSGIGPASDAMTVYAVNLRC